MARSHGKSAFFGDFHEFRIASFGAYEARARGFVEGETEFHAGNRGNHDFPYVLDSFYKVRLPHDNVAVGSEF
jgi:hypothetical protein